MNREEPSIISSSPLSICDKTDSSMTAKNSKTFDYHLLHEVGVVVESLHDGAAVEAAVVPAGHVTGVGLEEGWLKFVQLRFCLRLITSNGLGMCPGIVQSCGFAATASRPLAILSAFSRLASSTRRR